MLRLTTWNCKGAFHRKHAVISELRPDILVLPEAEKLEGVSHVLGAPAVSSVKWIGDNPKKGLGVVAYGDYSLSVHPSYDPRHKWILPLQVSGPAPCTLFAVWTVPHEDTSTYVQCVVDALDSYGELLAQPRVIWAGDFNNSVYFGKTAGRKPRFEAVLATLGGYGLRSLYHVHHDVAQGAEEHPTFHLYHHLDRPYHIDYVFATPDLIGKDLTVRVGEHAEWAAVSDHMPITVDLAHPA